MTLPTQNPIPSNTKNDQLFNAEKIDQVVNSDDLQYTDRFGKKRFTFAGLYNVIQNWIGSLTTSEGYDKIGKISSYNALKLTTPSKEGVRIILKSYYSGGLTGGGEFVSVAGSAVDDGGTICVPNSSTVYYWKRIVRNNTVDVDMFGAVNDGITDNTKYFNLAFNSIYDNINISSAGSYYINGIVGSLTVANSTKWLGDRYTTILMGPSSGFNVTGPFWGFSGINFIATGVSSYGIMSGYTNTSRKCFIRDCSFLASTAGNYFAIPIDLYAVWYSSFKNIYINHSGVDDFVKNVYAGIGLRLNYCVNNTVNDCKIGSCAIGLNLTSALHPTSGYACEGIVINNNTLIANLTNLDVREGYYISVTNNIIDIPLNATVNPVYFCGMCNNFAYNWISVAYGTIYIGKGESSAVRYDGSGNTFDGNVVRSSSGTTNNLVTTGPLGLIAITNNQFFFGGYAVVGGGGSNWFLDGNTFSAQATGTYDLHLVDKPSIGINKVYSPGTPTKSVGATAIVTPMCFSNVVPVTLAGDALGSNYVTTGQKFTVAVPAGYFLAAPEVAIASLATGSLLGLARYVKGESSSTSLVFSFVSIGSAVIAGSYNFSIVATDKTSAF